MSNGNGSNGWKDFVIKIIVGLLLLGSGAFIKDVAEGNTVDRKISVVESRLATVEANQQQIQRWLERVEKKLDRVIENHP